MKNDTVSARETGKGHSYPVFTRGETKNSADAADKMSENLAQAIPPPFDDDRL
jgi:hypothetical protein